MARSFLEPVPAQEGADLALVARLESQAASGHYTAPHAEVEEVLVSGPHGPVRVRVYRPAGGPGSVPFVWCHGGGFGGGDLDMPEADATARELTMHTGNVVVSVDYTLAKAGVHFPIPHDDVVAAYDWTVAQLGPAVIGGASAGANLAAGAALRLRDEGRPPLGVVLLYPLVHAELPEPSTELAAKLAVLTTQHAFRGPSFGPMVENYLGAPRAEASPYAMPALGELAGFPTTLVINCEYDGLRASGEAFAASLVAAGVPVTQLLAPDVLHGHINSPWLPQAQQSYADMASWLTTTAFQVASS
jgi:acetyl esterase/lipase